MDMNLKLSHMMKKILLLIHSGKSRYKEIILFGNYKRKSNLIKLEQYTLELYLNNELIKNLKPEMEVSPDAIVRTKKNERYYKDGKISEALIEGNIDTNLFEVA